MNKLIDLLNEYEKDKIKNSEGLDVMYIWEYEGILHYYNNYKDENIFDNVRFLIISKSYGFIKWLVDNDKIDRERINNRWGDMSIHFTDEELFIMSLSISNTPIEDLISYLK